MTTESRHRALSAVLREPFLHFTLVGALIFGGHYAFAKPTQAITVSAKTQAELDALFEQRQQRKPESKERAQLLERYVDDEVLFREGLARGLVQEDPGIREQVVARMRSVLQGSIVTAAPSDRELERFYQTHRERYALPAAVTFTEYVLPGETDDVARVLADALRAGTPVTHTPRVHRERSLVQLDTLYGPEVAARLFGEVIEQVRADYQSERAQASLEQAQKELRAHFSLNVEGH
jgi:hypothetical protein